MNKGKQINLMDKILALAKRRGFIYPDSEIYGGFANSWDFGPLGVEMKRNIKNLWWDMFVHKKDDIYGLDSAIIMSRKVWQASGHEEGFVDPLVECKKCHRRFREDAVVGNVCPDCGGELSEPKQFNVLFKTYIGPVEGDQSLSYLRGETAQGIFVNFKNVVNTSSPKIPFGIAQIGKSFRNEITPGNFIFRTREFEQMEIEYFIRENEWKKWFGHWEDEIKKWIKAVGIDNRLIYFTDIPKEDLAHYSKRTVDIEFDFPFGRKELYGLAYRTDFDLMAHQEHSGKSLEYFDIDTKERFIPHVIEPSLGVERTMLAIFVSAYREDNKRVWLDLDFKIAPYKVAVFPLVKNKKELVKKAREIYKNLISSGIGLIAWDDRGNIGKRYLSQDEIGTPYCITIDYQTLDDNSVTVRDRNTMNQKRINIGKLDNYLISKS